LDTTLAKNVEATFNNVKVMSLNLKNTSQYLSDITYDLKDGKGPLGMILTDTAMALQLRNAVNNINNGSTQFNELTKELNNTISKINSGDGVVSSLINDS